MGIAQRLKTETASLHKATEASVNLPGSVRSRDAYAVLLEGLRTFYLSAHTSMDVADWRPRWRELGVNLDRHDRVALLDADLDSLGVAAQPAPPLDFGLESIEQALGCLYVVEGSSLGGRFIGPAIASRVGDIPTAFYDGDGREHPRPWRSVQAALAAFDAKGGDDDAVIAGAETAFTWFGTIVGKREAA